MGSIPVVSVKNEAEEPSEAAAPVSPNAWAAVKDGAPLPFLVGFLMGFVIGAAAIGLQFASG